MRPCPFFVISTRLEPSKLRRAFSGAAAGAVGTREERTGGKKQGPSRVLLVRECEKRGRSLLDPPSLNRQESAELLSPSGVCGLAPGNTWLIAGTSIQTALHLPSGRLQRRPWPVVTPPGTVTTVSQRTTCIQTLRRYPRSTESASCG